ncbi:MAG: hypothetical protein ACUVUG_06510 [Candidatus Aminicenantia bacterium]
MRFWVFILIFLTNIWAIEVEKIEKYIENASLDALHPESNLILMTRKDSNGITQLYIVDGNSSQYKKEMVCISCSVKKAIGVDPSLIPILHKGASDWHPSGEWFITEVEIPFNISWRYSKKLPGTRLLAEPGAGWWNNLFLVKKDGSLWVKLTDFNPSDLNKGVLYPKFSKDGKIVAWAERIGGAKPFDKFPFAKWVMKIGTIVFENDVPKLKNVKILQIDNAAIFEPQDWSLENHLLFAADIGYLDLPYPAYRIDIWEAKIDRFGNIFSMKNLTKTNAFYEEQASYSPDQRYISFMGNLFDSNYNKRLSRAWEKFKNRQNNFITTNLITDLYLMNRNGNVLKRLTNFSEIDCGENHYLVTRSAWSKNGREIFLSLTLRNNYNGKKNGEIIYRIKLKANGEYN